MPRVYGMPVPLAHHKLRGDRLELIEHRYDGSLFNMALFCELFKLLLESAIFVRHLHFKSDNLELEVGRRSSQTFQPSCRTLSVHMGVREC